MQDELRNDVNRLNKAVWGDRDNPEGFPGLLAEQARMGIEQKRTNEILLELKGSVTWIIRLIVSGFVTALIAAFLAVVSNGGVA